jgi:hypothetical protein
MQKMIDVTELGFPDLRPLDLDREIDTNRCFKIGEDEDGFIFVCTRIRNHTGGRHATGNGRIITRVWS